VSKDLDIRGVYLGQEPQLKVGGDHPPRRPDEISQPPGDRPSPSTDLQTLVASSESKTLNTPFRKGVETLLQ
jgi:hypothetical protein